MVLGIIKRLFTSADGPAGATVTATAESFDHAGFRVQPAPIKEDGGWRVAGNISKEVDGEVLQHEFIRADVIANETEAVEVTSNKARRLIDEQGERLFRPRS